MSFVRILPLCVNNRSLSDIYASALWLLLICRVPWLRTATLQALYRIRSTAEAPELITSSLEALSIPRHKCPGGFVWWQWSL